MNQDTFKKAQEIQEQLEFFRKAHNSISKSGRYLWIRNCDMGEVRTVLLNYFISRIAELEKEFEAL